MYTGKQLKELIEKYISDEDIVCVGEKGDVLGIHDCQILGIEKRQVGFEDENDDIYKAIVIEPFHSNGTLKFWK